MTARWICILSFLLHVTAAPAWAEELKLTKSDEEPMLPFWSIILDIPDTAWYGMKSAFTKKALPGWGILLGSSAILYHYDEDILKDVQAKGRSWQLGNSVNYKSFIAIGDTTLYSVLS